MLINLDTNAQVQGTQVVRDFPSLTSVVQTAVRNWTFKPASLKGDPVPSSISMSVVFNIFNPGGAAMQSLSFPSAVKSGGCVAIHTAAGRFRIIRNLSG